VAGSKSGGKGKGVGVGVSVGIGVGVGVGVSVGIGVGDGVAVGATVAASVATATSTLAGGVDPQAANPRTMTSDRPANPIVLAPVQIFAVMLLHRRVVIYPNAPQVEKLSIAR
jgi:hypothetical protein